MLHDCQTMSLDNIYLEDIHHIIHPDTAARDLKDTTQPNRIIQEWTLPQGYIRFVSRYHQFHWQRPWMAYRDTLDDIQCGKLVLLKKNRADYAIPGVLTTTGDIRNDLPLFLRSRLSDLISRQLKRPIYSLRPSVAKTINSKAAGRLLAAGGIYNGNIEGFRKTAEQLGGDASAGFNQVMDSKALLITGASVVAGFAMGKMGTVNEIEKLSVLSKVPTRAPSERVIFETRQLQKKFKHAVDFNVSGNPGAEGLKSYEQAIKAHIDDPVTQQIVGKYRWNQDVNHYFNPETKIDVMTRPDGNFISGWKLSDTQISDLKGEGNVY
ncbi:hypothetical protein CKF42_09125 [Pantoea sp. ARC270]|uniref:colicin D domain-containing protein n=1 Tax=unclassified Pantoea TaxID=2630326 RepID=UPI000DA8CBB2|nr:MULTISPECIES: colicin D domain-containing protein [unclassified Pantoea]KAF6664345.1 hypothetical protein HFD92_11120 [Pantoea sp. EKM101V]PZL87192.1 hypothetical protein CKF42_09125 [Pantoea sp. ARC270]